MPVLDLAMCSGTQRGRDSRVPESSVKNRLDSGEPKRGTSRSAVTLAVLPGAYYNRKTIMSSSDGPEQRPVVSARQARQGVTGHNVRYVLGFSIAAVIIVFGIIWLIYFT
jgi:hypothetical protein